MASSKNITVRFCFDNSESEMIEKSKFSKDELNDVRRCLALDLVYNPGDMESSVKILSFEIVYDGITPFDECPGYVIKRKRKYPLEGYPTPIIRFMLSHAMNEEEFRTCIFNSSVHVLTDSMAGNDEEPYIAEDYNGYSSVLSRKERDQEIILLKINDAFCGKKFHFPEGMPENGYFISAMEFALPFKTHKSPE